MGKMVWVDTETTGLNPEEHILLELGMVITDYNLIVEDSMSMIFRFDRNDAMNRGLVYMEDVVVEMHNKSNLLVECLTADHRFTEHAGLISDAFAQFLVSHEATQLPMCGNTIQFDRAFLKEHLPSVESLFHYRNLDVSTLKNCYNLEMERFIEASGYSTDKDNFPQWDGGQKLHRVMPDIEDSISEFKFYREHLFR